MGCSTYALYIVSHRQGTKGFTNQWPFQQIKKLSYTLAGGHAIYTMACNSNAAADATGRWLSSKDSPHQTMRAHMEKELLRMISHKRRLVVKTA